MTGIGSFMTYALIAVFVQNMLFSGATGMTVTIFAARKVSRLLTIAVLVSVFALLGSLAMLPFDYYAPIWSSYMPVRGIILTGAIILCYLIISRIVSHIENLNDAIGEYLAPAALNGAVFGLPLLLNLNSITDPARVLGLAFGAGFGFALAAWLIAAGMRRADNPDIPPVFRGAPVMLIYIGILSLAFNAFGGGLQLFR
ncbi:MAG: hypothetical protein E7559_01020 [Ruminococcaceae bacterium]|nr:hypothetical protein [Oscillospiraceae bacterium]